MCGLAAPSVFLKLSWLGILLALCLSRGSLVAVLRAIGRAIIGTPVLR